MATSNDIKKGMCIEELSYKDENNFEWKIARIKNGFMVRYFGEEYFKQKTFECELSNGEWVRVKNTNCIFFQNVDFETFCEVRDIIKIGYTDDFFQNVDFETFCDVRDIIKIGYTDDIWETFEQLFTERFEHDKGMLESEMVR